MKATAERHQIGVRLVPDADMSTRLAGRLNLLKNPAPPSPSGGRNEAEEAEAGEANYCMGASVV